VIERVLREHPGRSVVIFTSGGPARSIVMSALNADPNQWAAWATWNTGITTLENNEGRWRLVKFNDTSHLEE
jgi:broad specificity phosphatase PhoE